MARAPRPYNGSIYIGGGHGGLREALGLVGERRHISQVDVLLLAPTKVAAVERIAGLGFYRPELRLNAEWQAYKRLDEAGLVTEDPLFFEGFRVGPVVRVMPDSNVFVVARFRVETAIGGRGLYVEPC